MDLRTARKVLAGPLKFGDPKQIDAVNFIARAEICRDALDNCPHGTEKCEECEGTGSCPRCGQDCEECDSTGLVKGDDCHCLDPYNGDDMAAANDLREEYYRKHGHPDEGVL